MKRIMTDLIAATLFFIAMTTQSCVRLDLKPLTTPRMNPRSDLTLPGTRFQVRHSPIRYTSP